MDAKIWVEIETTKSTGDTWTLKGKMLKTVYEAIVSNTQVSGYFNLDKVYWISTMYDDYGNKTDEKLRQYGGEGRLKTYRGDIFLKIEHLVSISPIDGAADLARFEKPGVRPLSVVSPIRP